MLQEMMNFISYLKVEKGYSVNTLQGYQVDLEGFIKFCMELDKEITWQSVDKDIARRWVLCMMERGNTANSVNRKLSALRSFYRYMLIRGKVQKDPIKNIRGPKGDIRLPVFLKEKEMNALFDDVVYSNDYEGMQDRAILLTFYMTGVRRSELIGLNVGDVDFSLKRIKVKGKRSKERYIPFGKELEMVFRELLENRKEVGLSSPLFINKKEKRLSVGKIARIVEYYLSLVTNVRKKTPHILRHTFATVMLNNEANLETVKELLGHNSLATTEVYTHTTFEELKKAYQNAHPRNNK